MLRVHYYICLVEDGLGQFHRAYSFVDSRMRGDISM